MTHGLAPAVGLALLLAGSTRPLCAQPQPPDPNVSRTQRAALQAIVRSIDGGATVTDVVDADWPVHVLRLSDGSHYVAFTVTTPSPSSANKAVVMYVRLATHADGTGSVLAERSGVADWLAGQTPGPPAARRGIDFGDLPTFGAGAIAARGPGPQSLQLLELERQRARERREADERERKATLEGTATARGPRPLLPFEDFDVRATPIADKGGATIFRRGLTAAPGDYDLVVGLADPDARDVAASTRIVRRRLILPPASMSEFALSSVIVSDSVAMRAAPLTPAEQAARPYTIGALDITPARDRYFTNDESVSFVVQVINARGSPAGKPDVLLGFRLFRKTGEREESIGILTPQTYDSNTVPPDFDASKRHPLFAAVAVPLRTFKRGDYRLEVAANDRIAGAGTTADAIFTVVATPAALLRDAPTLAPAFRREDLLQPAVLNAILSAASPPAPSPAFAAALSAARAGRFAELIRDDAVAAEEGDARQVLKVLALYALGDLPVSLMRSLQPLRQRHVTPGALDALTGGVRALDGADKDALAAWDAALAAGVDAHALAPLVADAWLRLGDSSRAGEIAERAAKGNDPLLLRRVAAARLAAGRSADALALTDTLLAQQPGDLDTQWLALHALFSGFVQQKGPGADAAGRTRIAQLAATYIAAGGRHAALASEWANAAK